MRIEGESGGEDKRMGVGGKGERVECEGEREL
jgi:hypothetical protein